MSSPSDTESEVSDTPHYQEHAQSNNRAGQDGQDGQDGIRSRRHAPTITQHLSSEHSVWSQRDASIHGIPNSMSSPSSSRNVPSTQIESSRYVNTPFPISNMPVEARRQSIMAMDRKRRLTGSTHDTSGRRRNLAGGFNEREEVSQNRTTDSLPLGAPSPRIHPQHRQHASSGAEVIDLTNSPPQSTASTLNFSRTHSGSASGVYIVPRWQPDSEVNACPICHRPFTFLFRRHHCRKCGRVVCNDCSPHRITIPRQYIVNPPGPSDYLSHGVRETVDLTGADDDEEGDDDPMSYASRHQRHSQYSGIGGGEKVRLCNPCVPDPQPELQPNYTSNALANASTPVRRDDLLTLSDALRSSRPGYHNSDATVPFPRLTPQHPLPYTIHPSRSRPLPLPPQSREDREADAPQLNAFPYSSHDRYRQRGHMSFESPQTMHLRHHSSDTSRMPQQPFSRPRVRSMLEDSYLPRVFSGNAPHSRPRLSEEDICPICRRALPLRGPGGDESARETHIMNCISARDPSSLSSSSRAPGLMQSSFRGPMHMLPFIATEKDCVGEDGNTPECSICMVEYDVGDELARLECLCKFHRECISEWFTRKQECPVHKIA